jgi:hypothetical protein
MKYTDYTPSRSADQIRADLAMIQSLRPDRKRNHKKRIPAVPEMVWTLCQVLAIVGFVACMYALFLEVFYR